MSNETHITLVGRITADPELRHTTSGTAVVNFTVAANPRVFNKDTNQWEDGPASFMDCEVWQTTAEHVAQTFRKASRVIVYGTLTQQTYTSRDGENRRRWVVKVDEIGPSLRFVSARLSEPDSARPRNDAVPVGADPWA